jgi:hypothetical protein
MPMTNFLEKAILEVLKEKAFPTTTKLYVAVFQSTLTKKTVATNTAGVKECAWNTYARQLFPSGSTFTEGGEGETEPSNIKNTGTAVTYSLPTIEPSGTEYNEPAYMGVVDTSTGTANIWLYAKLAAKAVVLKSSTEVTFPINALEFTAL